MIEVQVQEKTIFQLNKRTFQTVLRKIIIKKLDIDNFNYIGLSFKQHKYFTLISVYSLKR